MINTEEYKCVICGRSFVRRAENGSRSQRRTVLRKKGSLTCSRECARAIRGKEKWLRPKPW